MQYRGLTPQESFGLKPIQPFSDARAIQVKIGSYDVGGKLPDSISGNRAAKSIIKSNPQAPNIIGYNKPSQPKYDLFIIGGTIVLVLIVSLIVYDEYKRVHEEEA